MVESFHRKNTVAVRAALQALHSVTYRSWPLKLTETTFNFYRIVRLTALLDRDPLSSYTRQLSEVTTVAVRATFSFFLSISYWSTTVVVSFYTLCMLAHHAEENDASALVSLFSITFKKMYLRKMLKIPGLTPFRTSVTKLRCSHF